MFNHESALLDRGTADIAYGKVACDRILSPVQPAPPQSLMDSEIERLAHAGVRADETIYELELFADRLAGRCPPASDGGEATCCDPAANTPPVLHRLSHLIDQGHYRATRIARLLDRLTPLA